MDSITAEDLLKLSIEERLLLVEDLWDSIALEQQKVPLSDEVKKEIDSRLEAYRKNPDEGSRWEEVRERINRRLHGV